MLVLVLNLLGTTCQYVDLDLAVGCVDGSICVFVTLNGDTRANQQPPTHHHWKLVMTQLWMSPD